MRVELATNLREVVPLLKVRTSVLVLSQLRIRIYEDIVLNALRTKQMCNLDTNTNIITGRRLQESLLIKLPVSYNFYGEWLSTNCESTFNKEKGTVKLREGSLS